MSNFVTTVDFLSKDGMTPGDPLKIVKGAEIDSEFEAVAVASATKSNTASPTFTGTVVIPTLSVTGNITNGILDGGTY